MYAVLRSGNKQYKVSTGSILKIEKIEGNPGDKISFKDILFINNGKEIVVGAPIVKDAVVQAEIIEQFKNEKIIVFKKKRRHNYRRKRGHRQSLTSLKVISIKA
jgi:large subunit ribosomal protein L21